MPDFLFTSPDGKQYQVSGPDGATTEQAWAQLQQHLAAGTVETPDTRTPGERLGDLAMAPIRGLGHAGASVLSTAAKLGGAVPVMEDALTGALTGQPTTEMQDSYFKNVADPAVENEQSSALAPSQHATLPEKVLYGLGEGAGTLSQAALLGPEAAGPGVLAAAGRGMASMMVPAAESAVNTGDRVLQHTGSGGQAIQAAVTDFALQTAGGAMPAAVPGKLATRIASGAAIGAAQSEAQRRLQNQAMPGDMQSEFDPAGMASGAIMGAGFGAMHTPGAAPEPKPGGLSPAEQMDSVMGEKPAGPVGEAVETATPEVHPTAEVDPGAKQAAVAAQALDTATDVGDMKQAAMALATRPQNLVETPSTPTAQERLDALESPEHRAAEAARLTKLQEAVDLHSDLLANADQATTSDQRQQRMGLVTDQLGDLGNRTSAGAPDLRTPQEIAAANADPEYKQLFMNRIREDAGMTPGADQPTGLANPRPLSRWVDLHSMDADQAQQRLGIVQDQARAAGEDPRSLEIVPHPAGAPDKFAIRSNDVQRPLTPELQGNKAEAPPSTDPVDLYVAAQRKTNTPAARAFVGEYDAGRLSRDDVARAMAAEQRGANSVDRNVAPASAGTGLNRAEATTEPYGKPRGNGEERAAAIRDSWGQEMIGPKLPAGYTPPQRGDTAVSRVPDKGFEAATTVGEGVAHAANNGSAFEKEIAGLIMPYVKDTPLTVVTPQNAADTAPSRSFVQNARGAYFPGREHVYIKGADYPEHEQGANNGTVLHEALHVATVNKYREGLRPENAGSAIGQAATDMKALWDHVRAMVKSMKLPIDHGLAQALGKPEELITWGFVDPSTQETLRRIPGLVKRTAWGDFVDRVRSLFGMEKSHTSAFADLIEVSHRLVTTDMPSKSFKEGFADNRVFYENKGDGTDQVPNAPEQPPARNGATANVRGPDGARPGAGAAAAPAANRADEAVAAGAGAKPEPAGRGGASGAPRDSARVGSPAAALSEGASAAVANAPATRAADHATRIGARAVDAVKKASDALGLGDAIKEATDATLPMSAHDGSDAARAAAKDYANANRLAQYQWQKFVDILQQNFAPDRLTRMWDAADEENLIRGGNMDAAPDKGLASLRPEERAVVEKMSAYGEALLERARAAGLFAGEAVPFWTPRMAVMIGEDGSYYRPNNSGAVGVDITTSSPSLKGRKYLTAEETEAAQKARLGDNAELVRDIRTMPLAMARMERAVAGRELVNRVRDATVQAGLGGVRESPADGYFTLDHPAFKIYSPKMTTDPRTGQAAFVIDQFGQHVYEDRPLYIRNEFKGPLQSIVYDPPGKTYAALMALKRTSTGMIMYSPLIHNQVIFGKALSAVGFNPAKLVSLYIQGNQLRMGADNSMMREAIQNGMAPIGNYATHQDITDIASNAPITPGHGPIAKLVRKVAGDNAASAVDKVSDTWHNKLLWDRIADMQIGLYAHTKGKLEAQFLKMGLTPEQASRAAGLEAAHLANRYAGALPNEAMSGTARKFANLALFSRSFTLSNFGIFKDAVKGLPADVRSQLSTQFGQALADKVNGVARRKAQGMLLLEVGGMYVLNSLLQDAVKAWMHRDDDHSFAGNMADQLAKYGPRAKAAVAHAIADPGDVLPFVGHPFKFIHSFTSNGGNEDGLENRIRGANMNNGTATYYRAPVGKVGEDLEGWLSSPLRMAWQKSGTLVKPAIDIGMQVAGHPADGKNLWAPSDSALAAMGKAAAHFMAGQLPVSDAETAYDLVRGSTNHTTQNEQQRQQASLTKEKLALPLLTGVTVRQGAPGGPVAGAMFKAREESLQQRAYVMPEIHKLVQTGDPADRAQAIQMMKGLGMTPPEMISYLKYQTDPALRVNPRRLMELARTNPEGFQRVRQAMANEQP